MMEQNCLSKSSKDLACMALAKSVQELENEIKIGSKPQTSKTTNVLSQNATRKYK
jgi:hypothetical protein